MKRAVLLIFYLVLVVKAKEFLRADEKIRAEGSQYDTKSAKLLLEKTAKSAEVPENGAEDNEDIPVIEAQKPGVSYGLELEEPTDFINGQLTGEDEMGGPDDEDEIQEIRKSTSKDRKGFINTYEPAMSDDPEEPTEPVNGQLERDEEIGVPDEAEIQEIRKSASKDRKVLINGHKSVLSEGELDSEDDVKYELLEPMEDIAPNGWEKFAYSWCTIAGRDNNRRLYSRVGVPITYQRCQELCEARPGCTAVEFWTTYNYACFECTDTSRITPYTNTEDLAYPPHVWVQKPPTTAPPSPPTTVSSATPPVHPEINVTCGKHEMWISIPKYLFYGLEKEHLRLRDVGCVATETSTHFILHTGLTKCDTKIRHTKNFVCYMNTVLEVPVKEHQIITRVHEVEIPFSCYYSNMGVVSSVGLQVKSKKIVFSEKGFGEFELELRVYPDPKYVDYYKKKDFPVYIPLRKLLYVEVSVDTKDDRLRILAETCFASPDPDPSKPGLKYFLIKDGCRVDETVMSVPTSNPATDRFKFSAFKFLGDHQFVYLHCQVKICNATDPNSRCAQGCIEHRGKRSLYTEESESEEYNLAEGPFVREENKEIMEPQEAETGLRDMERSGLNTAVTTALAVVAAVCILGVAYFMWDHTKQRGRRIYRPLDFPVEE